MAAAKGPMAAVHAYVALGSNLDGPARRVRMAIDALGRLPDTALVAHSGLYRTAPIGYADQPDFVNAVALLRTALSPRALLSELMILEREAGRERGVPNGPRTLDLDLLLHGDAVAADAHLTLPHPRMHERAFVLLPLAEISPELQVPGHGSVRQLAACAASDQFVERLREPSLA
jgi:2-amino-4-hydroxy-6-hydroxymethyldihydropteridine diphosphokinase